MTSKAEKVLSDLVNGNLQDAKRLAREVSADALSDCARWEFGWSTERAHYAILYLKCGGTFQRYCDAN